MSIDVLPVKILIQIQCWYDTFLSAQYLVNQWLNSYQIFMPWPFEEWWKGINLPVFVRLSMHSCLSHNCMEYIDKTSQMTKLYRDDVSQKKKEDNSG